MGLALALLPGVSCVPWTGKQATSTPNQGVRITQLDDRLRVELDGQLFTEYRFRQVPRPYWYPLLGPGQLALTRNWPIVDIPGEERDDHPHHRSLWFAHGGVNGQDFWNEKTNCGSIVHQRFTRIQSDRQVGLIESQNQWVAVNGSVVCTDDRTMRIYRPGPAGERVFDFEVTLHASHGPLTLEDTKEGTMAVRMAQTLVINGKFGQGHVLNSLGLRDVAAWGKRADWCDYYGPVDGQTVGIAMFDHPLNPRHPTWWHVRDYGLFAANPFGQHDFENLTDKSAGNLVVPAGASVTFRYRFFLHAHDSEQAGVAQRYQDYLQTISKRN